MTNKGVTALMRKAERQLRCYFGGKRVREGRGVARLGRSKFQCEADEPLDFINREGLLDDSSRPEEFGDI